MSRTESNVGQQKRLVSSTAALRPPRLHATSRTNPLRDLMMVLDIAILHAGSIHSIRLISLGDRRPGTLHQESKVAPSMGSLPGRRREQPLLHLRCALSLRATVVGIISGGGPTNFG
jgi:hypothetical protein